MTEIVFDAFVDWKLWYPLTHDEKWWENGKIVKKWWKNGGKMMEKWKNGGKMEKLKWDWTIPYNHNAEKTVDDHWLIMSKW